MTGVDAAGAKVADLDLHHLPRLTLPQGPRLSLKSPTAKRAYNQKAALSNWSLLASVLRVASAGEASVGVIFRVWYGGSAATGCRSRWRDRDGVAEFARAPRAQNVRPYGVIKR